MGEERFISASEVTNLSDLDMGPPKTRVDDLAARVSALEARERARDAAYQSRAMSAWDEAAVVEAMARAIWDSQDRFVSWDETVKRAQSLARFYRNYAIAALTALAPHLAARDAAVRREALEEAAELCEREADARNGDTTLETMAVNILKLATGVEGVTVDTTGPNGEVWS